MIYTEPREEDRRTGPPAEVLPGRPGLRLVSWRLLTHFWWSLVGKRADVEIRAHAETCAMGAMPRFHPALRKPASRGAVTPNKKR